MDNQEALKILSAGYGLLLHDYLYTFDNEGRLCIDGCVVPPNEPVDFSQAKLFKVKINEQ